MMQIANYCQIYILIDIIDIYLAVKAPLTQLPY